MVRENSNLIKSNLITLLNPFERRRILKVLLSKKHASDRFIKIDWSSGNYCAWPWTCRAPVFSSTWIKARNWKCVTQYFQYFWLLLAWLLNDFISFHYVFIQNFPFPIIINESTLFFYFAKGQHSVNVYK